MFPERIPQNPVLKLTHRQGEGLQKPLPCTSFKTFTSSQTCIAEVQHQSKWSILQRMKYCKSVEWEIMIEPRPTLPPQRSKERSEEMPVFSVVNIPKSEDFSLKNIGSKSGAWVSPSHPWNCSKLPSEIHPLFSKWQQTESRAGQVTSTLRTLERSRTIPNLLEPLSKMCPNQASFRGHFKVLKQSETVSEGCEPLTHEHKDSPLKGPGEKILKKA